MTQTIEHFKGLPEDLLLRLNAIKAGGGKIVIVLTTSVSANYIIVSEK